MKPTTVEQSKRLLELGLDPDTADMFYNPVMDIDNGKCANFLEIPECIPFKEIKEHRELYMPAWSLEALLRCMPTGVDIKKHYDMDLDKVVYVCGKWDYDGAYTFDEIPIMNTAMYENPVDAAFELTVWILEHYTSNQRRNETNI